MGLEELAGDGLAETTNEVIADDAPIEIGTGDPMGGEILLSTDAEADDWYYADGVKGEGEMPEGFRPDKYTSVAAQAKAYTELESKFGAFTGAPKDGQYNITINDDIEDAGFSISDDDPMLEQAIDFARETNMNQEKFDEMINLYGKIRVEESNAAQEQEERHNNDQMKLLGSDAKVQITDILDWTKANLSKEQADFIYNIPFSATGVKALQAIIAQTQGGNLSPQEHSMAQDDLKARLAEMQFAKDEHGNRKLSVDFAFRGEYEKLKRQMSERS